MAREVSSPVSVHVFVKKRFDWGKNVTCWQFSFFCTQLQNDRRREHSLKSYEQNLLTKIRREANEIGHLAIIIPHLLLGSNYTFFVCFCDNFIFMGLFEILVLLPKEFWIIFFTSKRAFWIFRSYEENSDEAMKQCQALLEEPEIENAVRIGDVYAFIIDHFVRKEKFKAVSVLRAEICKFIIKFSHNTEHNKTEGVWGNVPSGLTAAQRFFWDVITSGCSDCAASFLDLKKFCDFHAIFVPIFRRLTPVWKNWRGGWPTAASSLSTFPWRRSRRSTELWTSRWVRLWTVCTARLHEELCPMRTMRWRRRSARPSELSARLRAVLYFRGDPKAPEGKVAPTPSHFQLLCSCWKAPARDHLSVTQFVRPSGRHVTCDFVLRLPSQLLVIQFW